MPFDNLAHVLGLRARQRPAASAFTYVSTTGGTERSLTYAELDGQARSIACFLHAQGMSGQRALLLYTPGLDFIIAFYACLYAGVVAIPAYPPETLHMSRALPRLRAIMADADPAIVLTTKALLSSAKGVSAGAIGPEPRPWIASDSLAAGDGAAWIEPAVSGSDIAFLQYTSGSTSTPKGVIVRHAHALANLRMIHAAYRPEVNLDDPSGDQSCAVVWLPFYHDMGLVGGILMTPWLGGHCVLMSPLDFLRRPLGWLRAIQRWKADYTACPNFALDLCVQRATPAELEGLDLRSLRTLIIGAEPVRAETLRRFEETFASHGVSATAFKPAYGLAETVLAVSSQIEGTPRVKGFDASSLAASRVIPSEDPGARMFVSAGPPMGGQRIAIVDPETGQECPPDRAGEIWVCGPNVAGGYWNRPEESRRTFGARIAGQTEPPFLRTGDLGFLSDGELYVAGRLKDLVIVRGQNLYPQDVEATVEQSDGSIRQNGTAAFAIEEDEGESLAIVAEVDIRGWPQGGMQRQRTIDEVLRAIRNAVGQAHGVSPSRVALIRLNALPKTSSGKVQRGASREALLRLELPVVGQWVAPSKKEVEAYLLEQIHAALRSSGAAATLEERLNELGLDSLAAVELRQRIERDLGVDVPLGQWLAGSRIGELAAQIAERSRNEPSLVVRAASADPSPVALTDWQPLSHGQQALWFLHQAAPESSAYHVAFAVRIRNGLDVPALQRAFAHLVRRHASLRTTYAARDGEPMARVHEDAGAALAVVDAPGWTPEELPERLADDAYRPFDLERGPVLRATLFRLAGSDYALLVAVHHIAVDLWSIQVLANDLGLLYTAEALGGALPPHTSPPVDFAGWQRELLSSAEGDRLFAYWRDILAGDLPVLDLPTDRPRPPAQTYAGGALWFSLNHDTSQTLGVLAKASGTTLHSLLLAAFQVLLFRLSGQDELLVGCPAAGRNAPGLDAAVGYFVNPVVVRARLSEDSTFGAVLERAAEAMRGAVEHQDFPFRLLVERLAPRRDPSRSPIFQAMFVLQKTHRLKDAGAFMLGKPGATLALGALEVEALALPERSAQFDLGLTMVSADGVLHGSFQYNADLFDATTIGRWAGHLQVLLDGIATHPERRISELPFLTPGERMQLLAHPPAGPALGIHIHDLLDAQAARTPFAIAVRFEGESLTYRELVGRADQLALRLQALGVGPEVRVGICLERSLCMAVALAGVLKAGGACVPLDPSYPKDRLQFMLADTQARIVLTIEALEQALPDHPCERLYLDRMWSELAAPATAPLRRAVTAENSAYVLYTSGSTGRPKGVMLPHRALCNRFFWGQSTFPLSEADAVLQNNSFSFDVAIWEFFGPWMAGARVVLARPGGHRDAAYLVQLIRDEAITAVDFVPSMLQVFLEEPGVEQCRSIRYVFCGGEALSFELQERCFAKLGAEIHNLYGPTEASLAVTAWACRRASPERIVPIGKPIANTRIFILSAALAPMPIGVPGEICIAGANLACGYLDRPELTAEKFVANPFSATPGERIYRTGDRGRWRSDGNLEYLGRMDRQVKVRGHRVELGEIVAVIEEHPAVVAAAAMVREDIPGRPRLVCYVVMRPHPRPVDLKGYLCTKLPEHMIPSAIVVLDAIPLTPNGKVNFDLLPPPDAASGGDGDVDHAHRSPVEGVLMALCAQILRMDRVGIHDDFFQLGGHSLLAAQLAGRICSAFGVDLPLRAIFEAPTVAGLARRIEAARRDDRLAPPPLVPAPRDASLPLSFAQQRLWFLDQLEPNSPLYHIPAAVRLEGRMDVAAFERSFLELVRRHEALRTAFPAIGGVPHQIIAPEPSFTLPILRLEHLAGSALDEEVRRLAAAEAVRPFDLAAGPLFRAVLLRLSDDVHVLLWTMHHIVSDGWSMGVAVREIAALYESFSAGRSSPLPELVIQYSDFSAWQRGWLSGEPLQRQLAYWREQLAGAPAALDLPTDRPRPAVQSHRGGIVPATLSLELSKSLLRFSRREGVTLFMTLLAAFNVLLYRYTGQEDIVIGSPIANRTRPELEGLIGFFVNTLALRATLSKEHRFRDLVRRIRDVTLDAYAHQDVPFEKLVEELAPVRDMSRSPIFQVMFALQNAPMPDLSLPGLTLHPLPPDGGAAKFDLMLSLEETAQGITGTLEYSTDLWDRTTAERMMEHFSVLLGGVADNPDQRISELPLLTAQERRRLLVEWNDTAADYPKDACIHELFEAQVEKTPDAVAVVFDDHKLTYRELDGRANQLAHHLRSLGAHAGTLVGLCLERSIELVVAILGILKSGGAYMPLDPSAPAERLRLLLDGTRAPILVTEEGLAARLPVEGLELVRMDADRAQIEARSTRAPMAKAHADNLAYVMHTSGSTGQPKGVCVPHRGVTRLVCGTHYAHFGPDEVFLHLAPVAFDASTFEIWGALLHGGRLVIAPAERLSLDALGTLLERQGVTTLWLTSSFFNTVMDADPGLLRGLGQLLVGGEALSVRHIRKALDELPSVRVINGYGPTENTTFTCCHPIAAVDSDGGIPIGRPIAHTTAHVLDGNGELVPIGVSGELCAGGDGLAQGYDGHAALTAERFVPDPFARKPGARLYRTGDIVRRRPDGILEFLGRRDHQVKIRGFRVELGEIETLLRGHVAIADAVVVVREDAPGDKRLVAYLVVQAGGAVPAERDLRHHLLRLLPDYMVPPAFVWLDVLPLSPNGKVNRGALPAPEARAGLEVAERPSSPSEALLAGVFADVLRIDRIGMHDDFFALGGHSLLATQVVGRIRSAFGLDLPLRALFEAPTVAALARRLEAARHDTPAAAPPLVPVPRDADLPLSFAQQRLWFLDQLEPNSPFYHIAAAVRLAGVLDVPALEQSFAELIRRHEALRTTFPSVNGVPRQVVLARASFSLQIIQVAPLAGDTRDQEVQRLAVEEALRPFDLAAGPLVRAVVLRIAEDEHVLLLTMHHIVSDGWSMGVAVREIAALYGAFSSGRPSPLPERLLQYPDFSVWQRKWLAGDTLQAQLSYWKQHLAGAPPALELPSDRPRPAMASYGGASIPLALSFELSEQLVKLSRREGVTLFMTLLAAFNVLLYRYTGQEEFVVGSPIANRTRPELEGLVGFFVNTLALRADLSRQPTFRELLRRIRDVTLGAYAHQDLPFEKLVEELAPVRDMSRAPIFQVMFVLQNAPMPDLSLPGLSLRPIPIDHGTTKFDLTLSLEETSDGIRGIFEYNTDLFDPATIERLARHFGVLLQGAADDPDQRISNLPLLTTAERWQLLAEREGTGHAPGKDSWNGARVDYPAGANIHHLLDAAAARTPDAIAVRFEGESLTYRELVCRAGRLAQRLNAFGVGPEIAVGICLERSLIMAVALVGVLKAGGVCVPLDPSYPADRLGFMLEDTRARLLLTVETLKDALPAHEAELVYLDRIWDELAGADTGTLRSHVEADHAAYVLYTSGSTGRPKGVILSHRALCNRFFWGQSTFPLSAADAILQNNSFSFDVAIWEFFGPWMAGARVVLARPGGHRDPAYLVRLIQDEAVTAVDFVPSMLQVFLEEPGVEQCRSIRYVFCGGEALSFELQERCFAKLGAEIHNLYGPTEASLAVTAWACRRASQERIVPIGRPIANTHIFILDGSLQPLPIGVPGEICIGGANLARGYLDRPETTAEQFVPNPFSEDPGERIYRTGDLGRWRSDGNLEYLGRMDRQVKIRGHRVELGEIVAVIEQHPAVVAAAAMVREDIPGQRRLAGYVVLRPEQGSLVDLERYLGGKLPEYMIPSAFVLLDALPLTPNGKVNLALLPPPETAPEGGGVRDAPRTPLEEVLVGLWSQVLGADRVGIHDDFFQCGGHSLLATQLVGRIRSAFGVDLPLRALFEAPTVAALARHVEKALRGDAVAALPLGPTPRDTDLPLSFAQQRLWFLDQLEPNSPFYNLAAAVRLTGSLNVPALERSLAELIRRHEALRTTFPAAGGVPEQRIVADASFSLPVLHIEPVAGNAPDAEVRRLAVEEALRPFDLAKGPLVRAVLARIADDEHVLLLNMHHIVSDGWSMGVAVREIAALYGAFSGDRPSPLPALSIQYPDFSAWQRRWLSGDTLQAQLSYWREQLAGAPPALELPTDRPRPPVQSYRGGTVPVVLSPDLSERLLQLSRRESVTLFMTLLAAFNVLFYRYTGQEDIVVGSPIANRTRPELEGLIGFFVNTLALRARLSGQPSFRELLRRIRDVTLDAYAHQDLPFEKLVEELAPVRDMSRSPIFQVMCSLENVPMPDLSLPGLVLQPLFIESGMAKFDLTLSLQQTARGITGTLEYNTDLFDRTTAERMIGHLLVLLEGVVRDPDERISALPLLTAAERHRLLVEWNDTTAEYPKDVCIHELFEAQVEKTSDAVALVYEDQHLSYGELNRRANQLAHYLRELGVGLEVRAGIWAEPALETMVGLMGILKAGAAYVPLDPSYPADRLSFMLADARAAVVLTKGPVQSLPHYDGVVVPLEHGGPWASRPETPPRPAVCADNAAYVIYTSGSTGLPNGVVVQHRSVINVAFARARRIFSSMSGPLRVGLSSSLSFDASVGLWIRLLHGDTIVILPEQTRRDSAALSATVEAGTVDTFDITPSQLASMMAAGFGTRPSLPRFRLVLGGEAVDHAMWEALFEHPAVEAFNTYGPTESTVEVTSCPIDASTRPHIGRLHPNIRAYVLDAHLGVVPVGVPGELWLGGAGLARGYLGRPALTAARFMPDPFSPETGARVYRTGDLVRWRPDGQLTFLGRRDDQVKIRGFRIELGEIETVLGRHPSIGEAAVTAREDTPGDRRLVAYLIAKPGSVTPIASELRNHLRHTLPDYMIPSAFVWLDAMPLSPSGKVDRKALPAPDPTAGSDHSAPPTTPAQELLLGLFADVLHAERIGIQDDFFALGGHSLLATQLASRIRSAFGIELPLRAVFEAPTVAALARRIETAGHGDGLAALPLVPTPRDADLPLSFAQQRLWFLDQLEPNSPFYNVAAALRLEGTLHVPALQRSVAELTRRHEALRTTFPSRGGVPEQRIGATASLSLSVLHLSAAPGDAVDQQVRRLATEEALRPFDLAAGPLVRAMLLRIEDDDHVLLLTMHHIVSDGWSTGVAIREIAALYEAFSHDRPSPLPELCIQYPDFSAWQRRWLSGEVLQTQLAYWKLHLAGAPPSLELPTDRPRPPVPSYRGAAVPVALSCELSEQLLKLSRREGVTLFMTLLAAFNVLLYRYTGQEELVVGSPIANRTRPELEGLIGFFVNTLALRTDLSGQPTFRDLLGRIREATLGAYAHQDLPFEKLVEELAPVRDMSRSPIFQVMFVLQNAPMPDLSLPGLTLRPISIEHTTTKFDLTLSLEETFEGICGALEYSTDLFDRATIERMAGHLGVLLQGCVDHPSRLISELPLLTTEERRQLLVEWNGAPAEYPKDSFVHELFEAQVEKTPDAVAVICGDDTKTYRELNERANQLAHYLRRVGVGPDVRVGICTERSPEAVAGLFGILKAGGAYVPLDPGHPTERLRFMIEDGGIGVLVTQTHLVSRLPRHDAAVVLIDSPAAFARERIDNPGNAVRPEGLAYVIYTSGSTGLPKGVMIPHRGLVHYVAWSIDAYQVAAGRGSLVHSSLAFDLTVTSVFAPLLCGRPVVLVAGEGEALADAIRAHQDMSLIKVTPAHVVALSTLLPADMATDRARVLIIGGEALPWPALSFFQQHTPHTRIVNEYGPTETVVGCSVYEIAAGERGTGFVPIGQPIPNTQLYVLDRNLELVPAGVPGELWIGGVGVARGYHRRPALTAGRFMPDRFSSEPGARLYRSGDLCRWRPDGHLEYLGRLDDQVKIRGFRIELGEIENVLGQHPSIRQAVVVAREDTPGEKRLVAYVVAHPGSMAPAAADLRDHLQRVLPDYMVPAAFVCLDVLPLSPNGKVARRALPAPDGGPRSSTRYAMPRTPDEQLLAAIFAEMLRVERIGLDDDFFELGGHSLLATQVTARLRAQVGADLPVRAIFESRNVARLARDVAQARRDPKNSMPQLTPGPREVPLPLTAAQEGLWFLQQLDPDSAAYNVPTALRVRAAVDPERLEQALGRLVERHEILRTVYVAPEGTPRQVVHPAAPVPIACHDLRGLPSEDRGARAMALVQAEALRPFDLSSGPVLRAAVILAGDDDTILLLTVHHIATDGWSTGVLLDELRCLYAGDTALPPLPVQYGDFARWQRAALDGTALDKQLAYWKRQLAALPVLDLPADHPRPPRQTFRGAVHHALIAPEVVRRLRDVGTAEHTTLFMTLYAGFAALLARWSGQDDIVVGAPVAGRTRVETERLIGFFIQTLVLRLDASGNPTFRELLARARETCLGAYAHQDVPFERLVEQLHPERDLSRTPLFQVMFALHPKVDEPALGNVAFEPIGESQGTAKFDLTVDCVETERGVDLAFDYNLDLFDPPTIERLGRHFVRLLDGATTRPDSPVRRIPLLDEGERARVVIEWNRTAMALEGPLRLHELVKAQAARTPDAIAVSLGDRRLTYHELDTWAARLASRLRRAGVGPDCPVPILVERSPEMVAGLLAILKAGGAYLPLDPALPAERLAFMVHDAGARIVLATPALRGVLPADAGVYVVELDGAVGETPLLEPAGVAPEHLAYVLYTSGSTGRPKGVMISHRAICHQLLWRQSRWPLGAGDRFLAKATFAFDVSLFEMFGPLLCGAEVVLARPGGQSDARYLAELCARAGVTVVLFPPSMLQVFLDEPAIAQCRGLRHVFCGGEALGRELAARVHERLPAAALHHLYGPTETCVDSTYFEVSRGPAEHAPAIGRPAANMQLYILDDQAEPVPVGVPGEIYLGGVQLARGYLRDPGRTAEGFVPDPFSAEPGARLYRTGDRGRFRLDGNVEFLGRFGHQVKIRGLRIELGEIEAVLASHDGVREAAVEARLLRGDRRLVAYVVPATEPPPSTDALQAHLRRKLPEYMVPAAIVPLPSLPRMPNGKLDRRALPDPDAAAFVRQGYLPPRDKLEASVAAIWEALLNVPQVGLADDFFALGGHSLLAVQLVARLRRELGRELPLAALFEARTLEGVCEALRTRATYAPLVSLATEGTRPPLYCVHPLGGTVFCFADLARHLAPHRPLYGLQAPGLTADAPPRSSIEALAELYVEAIRARQPRGPYHLAGYSMGGLIALEMARRLDAVGLLAILDAVPPSPWLRAFPEATDAELIAEALGTPAASAALDEEAADLLPMLRAHQRAMRAYEPATYPGPVVVLLADASIAVGAADTWRALAPRAEVHPLPGDHHSLLHEPHVAVLAQQLENLLVRR